MTSSSYDQAVVGAGILGLACARELLRRRPDRRVVVVEADDAVASGQSGHNSGVIHAGVYYRPGSLKARLCVEGASLMYDYCQAHGIETRRLGKLIIATAPEELPGLHEIERRARANGVPGIRRLPSEEIADIEPHAAGLAALHSPGTGIVDFRAVCRSLATEVHAAGGELRSGWRVNGIQDRTRGLRLVGPGGQVIEAAGAVFCAGLQADRLAVQAGASPDPRILPFRGAYLQLRSERAGMVRGLVYPVPDPSVPFLGVHLTPTIAGEVLVGPTALLVAARDGYRLGTVRAGDLAETLSWPGTWRMMARWWRTGLDELRLAFGRRACAARAARYIPNLTADDLIPAFAGIRAQAVSRDGRLVDDFVLSCTGRTVHVRNAPSPAATSALALARLVVDQMERQLL